MCNSLPLCSHRVKPPAQGGLHKLVVWGIITMTIGFVFFLLFPYRFEDLRGKDDKDSEKD